MQSGKQIHSECAWVLAIALLLAAAGCDGRARVDYTSLDFANIDPPGTRVTRHEMPHCYWWMDDRNQLWIAMERHAPSILGLVWSSEARIVFVLERPPAGRGRNYVVGKREMRGAATFGLVDVRYVAQQGLIGVNRDSADSNELRGSFRIQAGFSVSQMLGGWGRPTAVLMFGDFVAVQDEQRGRRVVEAAGLNRWEEESRPTVTQPSGETGTNPDVIPPG